MVRALSFVTESNDNEQSRATQQKDHSAAKEEPMAPKSLCHHSRLQVLKTLTLDDLAFLVGVPHINGIAERTGPVAPLIGNRLS